MGRSIRFVRHSLLAAIPLATVLLLAELPSRADEFKLKDGTKITGTIVGFEENSFKVKTSYGYAVVQKDQVLTITVETAKAEPERKPEAAAEKTSPPERPRTEAVAPAAPVIASAPTQPSAPASKPAAAVAAKPATSPIAPPAPTPVAVAAQPKPSAPAPTSVAAAAPSKPSAPTPVAVAAPAKPPVPEPIHEAVVGNKYTNETYRFQMYKPPDWDVIAAAPAVMPGAITAMGTADGTTYLLIGQAPAGKSLATDLDSTERRLRDVMEHFHPSDAKQIMVSGTPATEQRFNGSVDEHDWSGVFVLMQRGARLYTIFGMTRADNDLVQIQENVIGRAISSLQFSEQ